MKFQAGIVAGFLLWALAIWACTLLLPGCATYTMERLDKTEKVLLLGNFALHAVDAAQTMSAMDDGGYREGNPFMSEHPSHGEIIGVKVLASGLTYLLVCNLPEESHAAKKVLLGLTGLVTGGVIVHNFDAMSD
jgi:hypothetical protein